MGKTVTATPPRRLDQLAAALGGVERIETSVLEDGSTEILAAGVTTAELEAALEQLEPERDPLETFRAAIAGASSLEELKAALLGNADAPGAAPLRGGGRP